MMGDWIDGVVFQDKKKKAPFTEKGKGAKG
jgi:hypothetical protein